MVIRSLFIMHSKFHKVPYLFLSFTRSIRMENFHRKSKMNIVKRKFLNTEDKSYEVLQVKEASSVMKRLNWENKHLFGNIITTVKKTFSKGRKSNIFRNRNRNAEVLDEVVPIRDVKLNGEAYGMLYNGNVLDSWNSQDIMANVMDFPLTSSVDPEKDEHLIVKLNYLRQHISSLCESSSLPSVTSILEKTMPPERAIALERWKAKMIKQMGPENFKKYQQDLLDQGSNLHHCINYYLTGDAETDLPIEPHNKGHWTSLRNVFAYMDDVKLLQQTVVHPFLCYRGILDCFASYKNRFVIIDWKTSEKFKPSLSNTFDSPLQVAAYAGALQFNPRLNYKVSEGLVVVAYKNGNPASVHYMDEAVLLSYWKQWLQRLKSYWENVENSKK